MMAIVAAEAFTTTLAVTAKAASSTKRNRNIRILHAGRAYSINLSEALAERQTPKARAPTDQRFGNAQPGAYEVLSQPPSSLPRDLPRMPKL
jgi:hypothetical protein